MPGPLDGVRIVDFTWAWAGPYGAMLLSLLGADIVKIESRTRMDQARIGSIVLGQAKGNYNQQPMFNELNLGKRSIAMNLKAPGAAQVVKQLYAVSDAVMDNFRPGTLDKLGLGYDVMTAIRPDHILLSASALGASGPERNYGGYAPTFAALAGLVALAGQPGAEPMLDRRHRRPARRDGGGGWRCWRRSTTAIGRGSGMFVDHSARESVSMLIGDALLAAQIRPPANPTDEPERLGNGHRALAPHGLYRCAGESAAVAIVCRDDAQWAALLALSGLPLGADPRFATGLSRWKHRTALDAAIGAWTATQEAEPLAARLQAVGVPASVGRNADESPVRLATVPGPRRPGRGGAGGLRPAAGRAAAVAHVAHAGVDPGARPLARRRQPPRPCRNCWATTPPASPRWRRVAPWSDAGRALWDNLCQNENRRRHAERAAPSQGGSHAHRPNPFPPPIPAGADGHGAARRADPRRTPRRRSRPPAWPTPQAQEIIIPMAPADEGGDGLSGSGASEWLPFAVLLGPFLVVVSGLLWLTFRIDASEAEEE